MNKVTEVVEQEALSEVSLLISAMFSSRLKKNLPKSDTDSNSQCLIICCLMVVATTSWL